MLKHGILHGVYNCIYIRTIEVLFEIRRRFILFKDTDANLYIPVY